ncbi:MAG: hypothetical protein J6O88_10315 [Chryseobacterium sp.]|uniref:hypothetical protein n=1 Tax=Chryseobacterium sp. TaxID=1871047 RepID=UPI001B1EF2A6|nr:hypothetical protein [Chryseobacterium sp.]MBO6185060.1 hypothetical protein [Chryseobacterium sp.]
MSLSGFAFAQESSDNQFIYQTDTTELADEEEEDVYPANPGDVPIDDYIPVLLVVAVAFVIAFANKKKLTEE